MVLFCEGVVSRSFIGSMSRVRPAKMLMLRVCGRTSEMESEDLLVVDILVERKGIWRWVFFDRNDGKVSAVMVVALRRRSAGAGRMVLVDLSCLRFCSVMCS